LAKQLVNCQSLPHSNNQNDTIISAVKEWKDHLKFQRETYGHSADLMASIGILDMILSSLQAAAEVISICDHSGRVQSVAISKINPEYLTAVADDKLITGDIAYLSLLASRPSDMKNKAKGAGLEALAEVFRQNPSAKAMALDPTGKSRSFYRKFGFYFGDSFTITLEREAFFEKYRSYYQACAR
jgi:hypothetical protein